MDATFLARDDRLALAPLMRRRDGPGLARLAAHAVLLALTGAAVWTARGSAWIAPALVAHGVVLAFLFAPLHESIHGTAFRSRWLNAAVGLACGALVGLPPRYFRAFHFAHHRHTHDPERDPELARPAPSTLGAYVWHVSGAPHWAERATTTLRHAAGHVREPWIGAADRARIAREARVLLVAYLAVAAVSFAGLGTAPLVYWVVPLALGQPALRLYLLAEHTGCPHRRDMLVCSRTTRSNALVRGLAWNMPLHGEHHACPALPFHALPRAHALLRGRPRSQSRGYAAFHRELVASLWERPTTG